VMLALAPIVLVAPFIVEPYFSRSNDAARLDQRIDRVYFDLMKEVEAVATLKREVADLQAHIKRLETERPRP
jgi:cell division protein FtsB